MADRKKRVLFVSINLAGGGAERVVAVLLEHLDRTRFEPGLVLFQDKQDYSLPKDIPVFCLQKNAWYDYPKLIWKLSQIYRKWKPDVVLSIQHYSNGISMLARMVSNARIKLILSEHNILSFYLKQHQDPLTLFFDEWMPRWLYKYAEKVICVSQHSADDVHQIFKLPVEKIKVIYNPLDTQKILTLCKEDVQHPWFTESKPVIISIGSLIDVKGYPYLLRAFTQVVNKYPSHLMILGKGDKETALKDLAKQLGIEEEVTFLGFQSNPFKYAAHSSVFVLSSLTEAFPMAVLEAMTCGIPVIATASPGSREIIVDGTSGLLVPPANENALAQAIEKLLDNDKFANNLAQEGKRRVCDFSMEKAIKQYEELFG